MASVGIVDDDKAVTEALRFSLESGGFTVETYGSASAFLGDKDALLLGCLVIDQQMPDMTGIELVTVLRSRRCFIPSILITTWPNQDLRVRALNAGCRAVLEKPLAGNTLSDSIHAAIDETRSLSV